MATFDTTVDVLVTKSSSGVTWEYSLDGGILQSGPLTIATIHPGDTLNVTLNILAGVEGDQCVFQSTPLTFFRPTDPPTPFTPEWYDPTLSNDNATLTFTDSDNNSGHQAYSFLIHATYTQVASTSQSIDSPDPTIVNEGTGMFDPAEGQAEASQVQTQSV